MSEPVYSRARDVIWRLAPDRVLVRRVGEEGAAELIGGAALVWIALDEPGDRDAIQLRLGSFSGDFLAATEQLVVHSWLASTSA